MSALSTCTEPNTKVLARAMRQENDIKGTKIEKMLLSSFLSSLNGFANIMIVISSYYFFDGRKCILN